jgi:hypothetical protein
MVVLAKRGAISGEERAAMGWRGKTRVGSKFGGQHGGLAKIGDVVVPRTAVYVHDGDVGEPDLEVTFEVRDGRPECVDFHVRTKPDGRGIRTADLQMVTNLDAIAAHLYAAVAPVPDPEGGSAFNWMWRQDEEHTRRVQRAAYEARKARRGTVTRADLEQVAKVYRENLAASPTRAVSLLLGYTERTAARRVQQARAAGLLPETTKGKRRA